MSWADNGKPKKKATRKKPAPKKPGKKVQVRKKRPTGKRRKRSDGGAKTAKTLDPLIDTWTQQPKETGPAFAAFQVYRDSQPHDRSLVKTAAIVKKAESLIGKWSAWWSWVMRARDWDREREREVLEANIGDIVKMRQEQALGAAVIQRALLGPAMAIVREMEKDPDLLLHGLRDSEGKVRVSRLNELIHLVVATSKVFPAVAAIERISRGEPTAIHDHRMTDGREVTAAAMDDPEIRDQMLTLFESIHGIADVPVLPIDTNNNGAEK